MGERAEPRFVSTRAKMSELVCGLCFELSSLSTLALYKLNISVLHMHMSF